MVEIFIPVSLLRCLEIMKSSYIEIISLYLTCSTLNQETAVRQSDRKHIHRQLKCACLSIYVPHIIFPAEPHQD